jgi:hypothetical protein
MGSQSSARYAATNLRPASTANIPTPTSIADPLSGTEFVGLLAATIKNVPLAVQP